MKTYRFAISMTVLLLSTFVTVEAAVADAGGVKARGLNVGPSVIHPNLAVGKSSRLPNPTPKLSRRARARLASLISRGCGCPLTQDDQDVFGSCWKNCIINSGVSSTTMLACGGFCVGAGTGNPVGIALCAACLGTSEWILAGCTLYCAWGGGGGHGILQQDPQAKLRKGSPNSIRTVKKAPVSQPMASANSLG